MTLLTIRVGEYAAQFAALNDEVIAVVTACPDEQWRQPSGSEEWPVAVVAHHIAEVNQAFAGILETLLAGEAFSPRSFMEEIDQLNAQHAQDFAMVGKPETLAALRASGAALGQLVGRLGEENLDRHAGVFGGHALSVAQVLEWIVIGHAAEHLASIRATIEA